MKKTLALFIAMMMMVALFTGCGGDTQTESSKRTDINIPLASIGNTLDPHDAVLLVDQYVCNQIYEPLWYVEDDASLTPRLATGYTVNDAGNEITVTIRDDVKFQNGEPLKASDVVYSYQRCLDNYYKPTSLQGLTKVEAINDTTVKFTLDGPNSIFLTTMNDVWIVPEKAVEEAGDRFGAIPTREFDS